MCKDCDYREMLISRGLEPTPNRIRILEILGDKDAPLGAQDIFARIRVKQPIHRVTVYRILDLLKEKGLVQVLGGTPRGVVYGLAPNENHPDHPHFQCRRCGILYCLKPVRSMVDLNQIRRAAPGVVGEVKVLVGGICSGCLGKG